MRKVFCLQWWDGCGGTYMYTFRSQEERDTFRKRVERVDKHGKSNVQTWESTVRDPEH